MRSIVVQHELHQLFPAEAALVGDQLVRREKPPAQKARDGSAQAFRAIERCRAAARQLRRSSWLEYRLQSLLGDEMTRERDDQ
jgi:hypothetical protein